LELRSILHMSYMQYIPTYTINNFKLKGHNYKVIDLVVESYKFIENSSPSYSLAHKQFVLAAKMGLCWRVERPPSTLCQQKLSYCWRVSTRQHRDGCLSCPPPLRFSSQRRKSKNLFLGRNPTNHPQVAHFSRKVAMIRGCRGRPCASKNCLIVDGCLPTSIETGA
jgi:hypothetical protein